MKTLTQLRAKIAAMPRAELELFAENVDKECDGDTIVAVADDIASADLNPDRL